MNGDNREAVERLGDRARIGRFTRTKLEWDGPRGLRSNRTVHADYARIHYAYIGAAQIIQKYMRRSNRQMLSPVGDNGLLYLVIMLMITMNIVDIIFPCSQVK